MNFDEQELESAEEFIMPWGHFAGRPLKDIPDSYIRFLSTISNDEIASKADIVRRWREDFDIEVDE